MSDEIGVGSPAPDFRLPASDGRELNLAAYRNNSLLVLFFVREHH